MRIGIAGAHRTGKTTLAEDFAQAARIQVIKTSSTQAAKDVGVDPSKPMTFTERMLLQEAIYHTLKAQWAEHDLFITDRTPFDLLMYTYAEITPHHAPTETEMKWLQLYRESCIKLTNDTFDLIIHLQPGIKYISESDKGFANPAYIEHLNTLVRGMFEWGSVPVASVPRSTTGRLERVDVICEVTNSLVKGRAEELKQAREFGIVN